jgi:hypothetical protein
MLHVPIAPQAQIYIKKRSYNFHQKSVQVQYHLSSSLPLQPNDRCMLSAHHQLTDSFFSFFFSLFFFALVLLVVMPWVVGH